MAMKTKVLLTLLLSLYFGRALANDSFSLGPAILAATTAQTGFSTSQPNALGLLFGPLEPGFMGKQISVRLMAWSLPWMAAGIVGLWANSGSGSTDWQKGFWGMNATWALINTGIAYAGLLGNEPSRDSLQTVLWVNAGLDVLYLAGGAYMMSRNEEVWRGAGLGVVIQAAFLFLFDGLQAALI